MKHGINVIFLGALIVSVVGLPLTTRADDTDIFLVDTVEPNVVILLDSSGSMDDTLSGGSFSGGGGGSWGGSRGGRRGGGGRGGGGVTGGGTANPDKMEIAKTVISGLIENVSGVRIGVFKFNDDADAGVLVAPAGADPDGMVTAVNSVNPNGATPLGRATETVRDYFRGLYTETTTSGGGWDGGGRGGGGRGGGGRGGGGHGGGGHGGGGHGGGGHGGGGTTTTTSYPSPIEEACQKNYVIIVTDGMPNGEDENLVADVARRLYTSDHSALDGTQNVIVHTVGFDVPAGRDLLTATATNGGGSFYTADTAAQLELALQQAFSEILEDAYNFAMPLMPSTSVAGGSLAYLASFEPDAVSPFWEGYLKAYRRGADGGVPITATGEPNAAALAWDAGVQLAAKSASTRMIYTAIRGARQPFVASNSSLTPALLDVASSGTANDVINFIRGIDSFDGDGDGNATEQRPWKLGDIVHSAPVLVFPPPGKSADADYVAFKSNRANRPTILLVGANDGMLHAFRATDGEELWGFIPPDLLPNLQDLSVRIGDHPYFVDSSPIVADVKTGDSWKTIVIFGERRGGRSYHALDISDTTNPLYLWSFTDAEMGESWSEPGIGKIRLEDGTDRYVAFVGGGYDTASNNASGRAVFAIDLADGNKLWEFKLGAANDSRHMNFSVPARPTVADLDYDGYVDRIYVGDVGGQLWKFDISAEATFAGGLVNNWSGKRLLQAAPSQTNPPAAGEFFASEAMYGSPALAYDSDHHLWVFVGSGDRNHPKTTSSDNFYGIKDTTDMSNGSALTPASLVDVTSGSTVVQGWYYPLTANEKVLAAADVFNEVVYFTTHSPQSTDPCEGNTGSGKLYAIRLEDGLPALDWTDGEKLENPDGSETPSTDVGDGIPTDPEIVLDGPTDSIVVGSTDGELTEVSLPATRTKRIRYWREVF